MHIDLSFERFKTYILEVEEYITKDLTESDTRSKLIDSLLINVLGWEERDIKREEKVDSGYYDYVVSIPGFHFIVEAKRQFKYFTLPTVHSKAKLKTFIKNNEEIVNQIRGYAGDYGVNYGVITNGKQFVILKLFNTDGTSWKDNPALIFNSLEEIEKRFVEFYNNLSKSSIIQNGGFNYDLVKSENSFQTLYSKIPDREKELIRNPLSSRITPVIQKVFGEIFTSEQKLNEDFIKECFVENEEIKKNRDEIERLFLDRAPLISEAIPAVNSENIRNQITTEILNYNDGEITMSPPKPIVIIGSKGAGKSTFINHLFKYSSEDNLQNSVVVYLDLRDFFHSNDQFESKSICKFILNKIYDENENFGLHDLNVLKNIYIKEITQKDKGVWKYIKENDNKEYELKLSEFLTESQSDEVSHLEYVSKFLLTNRRKRLILIVDNADQYNDKIQEQVFLFSHSITKRLLCGSVISLREGYYYKWRFAPPFDAYQSNVYHITAPNYSEVLQKRINYALSNINLTQIDIEDKNSQGQRIKISNRSVVEFLSNLQYSLFESQNSEIVNFLNKTTYPNIREGLRIFSLFLTSGHTKVDEYILRERFRTEKDKHNMIPLHEFVKSVGLINKHYYSSRNSTIHNILIPAENSSDLFLNYYLLKHFSRTLEDKGYKQKYLSFLEVVSLFVDLGYRSNVIENSISNLLNYQLIDTENSLTDTMDILTNDNVNMAITLKGYYYVNELITHFHYLDLIVQDTPVYDDNYFQKIYKVFPMSDESGNRSLSDRAKTVRVFVDYLKFEEDKQSVRIQKMFKSFTDHIHSNLNKDLAVINTRVNVS